MSREDATTPYYYGSLPAKPELGHILVLEETGNRYAVIRIEGEGLEGKGGNADQMELAWADIGARKAVPTLWLQQLTKETVAQGRSFSAEEMKEYSQKNREIRLWASAN